MSNLRPAKIGPALAALALIVAIGVLLGFGGDVRQAPPAKAVPPAASPPAASSPAETAPDSKRLRRPREPVPTLNSPPARGPAFELVQLTEGASVQLRRRPRGRIVESIGPETEFGSEVILSVVRKQGPWLGILTPELSNGQIGWIRFDPGKMQRAWTKYVIKVDTSAQEMTLGYSGKTITRHTVTVGALGSETPTGRFAVTDAIDYGASAAYGCCALALTAHQPNLTVGWSGGDRIAIHGTPGVVGGAVSHGCIRAANETMLMLFGRVPLGTPVFISG